MSRAPILGPYVGPCGKPLTKVEYGAWLRTIRKLFKAGFDTYEIASQFECFEADIYNALHRRRAKPKLVG